MRKILRFTRREYLAAVKTKGFIIMLVMMPIMMGGSGIAMMLFSNQVDTTDRRVAVIDYSGRVAGVLQTAAETRNRQSVFDPESGKKVQPAWILEVVAPDRANPQAQRLELSDRIREGSLHAFLEIGADVFDLVGDPEDHRFRYHANNAAIDTFRNWSNNLINTHLRKTRMIEAGIEEQQTDHILAWIQVEPMGLVSVDEAGEIREARRTGEAEAMLLPLILFFLMFAMVMMGAMPLLQSTFEEKTQRIAEVLLGSLKPVQFMAGKVLGGLGVSLTGAAVYVGGGILFMGRLGLSNLIPFHIIPWFFTFLILEIVMMGSMLAALGSACNDPKDAQNLTFPAMLPVFLPMFILLPVLQEPNSGFATLLSLIPPFTPMLMLLREATPMAIPAWQPWAGLAGVLLFTVFMVWLGGRIFRVGILMQGGPPKLSNMIRWAFRG
jgi:ABC-2 type transport system permease protein